MFKRALMPLFAAAFAVVTLSSCSSIQVSQDYQPGADFSQYKSYEWLPENMQTKPKQATFEKQNQLIAERINSAIVGDFKKKGFSFVESGADAYVTYHIKVSTKIRSLPVTTTIGVGTYWNHGSIGMQTSPEVEQYEEGTLIVDVLDKNNKLLWRGTSTTYVEQHSDPQDTTKLVNEVVAKLLEQYPPKKKK